MSIEIASSTAIKAHSSKELALLNCIEVGPVGNERTGRQDFKLTTEPKPPLDPDIPPKVPPVVPPKGPVEPEPQPTVPKVDPPTTEPPKKEPPKAIDDPPGPAPGV